MTRVPHRGPLVIGLGSPDRGDDAVGTTVAGLAGARWPSATVVTHEDPTALLDLWSTHDPVVVVDAVSSDAPAGTVHLLETGRGGPAVGALRWERQGLRSTHALGLAEMVELARALGRLPERLVVIGVEGECFDHGEPLSPPVSEAVPVAVERVVEELSRSPRPKGMVAHVPR